MERVLVVGAGFMGAGIAQVAAQRGYKVSLMDPSQEALEKALAGMKGSLVKLYDKGQVADPPEKVLERVSLVKDLSPAARAHWVVEAALEVEELKLEIFRELDRLAPPDTPLGSNTSSIPIGRLAGATERPERVLGTHFFGPVPLMGLVELVKGPKTSDEVFERAYQWVRSLGKTPVRVNQDIPGFVMNRVFAAALSEALDLVAAGVTRPEDIDAGMRLGYGWRSGPFEIADNAGLDTFALINRFLRSQGEDRLVAKTDLVERMVAEGRTGRKVGKGFYDYHSDGTKSPYPEKD